MSSQYDPYSGNGPTSEQYGHDHTQTGWQQTRPYAQQPYAQQPYPQQAYQQPYPQQPHQQGWSSGPTPGQGLQPWSPAMGVGRLGQVRGTGSTILLGIVTFGIYWVYWEYVTHEEMKRHSGNGMGGLVALLLSLLGLGVILLFTMPAEVEKLYQRRGLASPVSGATGLWVLLPVIGGLVWTARVNGALNDYWRSQGARG